MVSTVAAAELMVDIGWLPSSADILGIGTNSEVMERKR